MLGSAPGGYGTTLRQRMPKLDKWALNVVGGLVLPLTMAAEDEEVCAGHLPPRVSHAPVVDWCRHAELVLPCERSRSQSRPCQRLLWEGWCAPPALGRVGQTQALPAAAQMPGSQLHPDQEGDSRDDEKAAEERATGSLKGASSDADNSSPGGGATPGLGLGSGSGLDFNNTLSGSRSTPASH